MAKKAPMLQIGAGDSYYARTTSMPIAMANRRIVQSAKDRHLSAHHIREMAKLSTGSSTHTQTQSTPFGKGKVLAPLSGGSSSPSKSIIGTRSSAVSSLDAMKHLEHAFKIRSSAAVAMSPVPRPMSSGAFKPRKVEPTRFRYFCASLVSMQCEGGGDWTLTSSACVLQTTAAICLCA